MVNKLLVRKCFKRSLYTYNNYAIVQNKMAYNLIKFLLVKSDICFHKIFEFGCGSGLLTNLIINKLRYDKLIVNDLVVDCLDIIKKINININFIPGDIEEISIPEDLDLIISNATIQWINDLELICYKFFKSLNKNGFLAFTTFGKLNFLEFKKLNFSSLNYYDKDEIIKIFSKYFDLLFVTESVEVIYFSEVLDILKHIKYTGVNGISNFIWTKKTLTEFINKYNKNFKTDNGISLTYNPLYFIFKKK